MMLKQSLIDIFFILAILLNLSTPVAAQTQAQDKIKALQQERKAIESPQNVISLQFINEIDNRAIKPGSLRLYFEYTFVSNNKNLGETQGKSSIAGNTAIELPPGGGTFTKTRVYGSFISAIDDKSELILESGKSCKNLGQAINTQKSGTVFIQLGTQISVEKPTFTLMCNLSQ